MCSSTLTCTGRSCVSSDQSERSPRSGGSESTLSSRGVQRNAADNLDGGPFEPSEYELGHPLSAFDANSPGLDSPGKSVCEGFLAGWAGKIGCTKSRRRVQQDDLDRSAVTRIDGARGVRDRQSPFERLSGSRTHLSFESLREGDSDASTHQGAISRRENCLLACHEVEPGVPRVSRDESPPGGLGIAKRRVLRQELDLHRIFHGGRIAPVRPSRKDSVPLPAMWLLRNSAVYSIDSRNPHGRAASRSTPRLNPYREEPHMSSLFDMLGELTGQESANLAEAIGADESSTQNAMRAALPLLLGALQRNAASPEGAESLQGALERDHDGSILDSLGDLIRDPSVSSGTGILKHALGGRQRAVEQGVGQSSGLSPAQASRLLTTLAPVVMGMLGKAKREQGLDAGGLADLLTGERQAAESSAPDLASLAGLLIDGDGDGLDMGDITKIGGGLLAGLFKKS